MNMMPQPMQKISCIFDTDLYKYKLKWQEPADTIINGQVACLVDKVIIRRKLGYGKLPELQKVQHTESAACDRGHPVQPRRERLRLQSDVVRRRRQQERREQESRESVL